MPGLQTSPQALPRISVRGPPPWRAGVPECGDAGGQARNSFISERHLHGSDAARRAWMRAGRRAGRRGNEPCPTTGRDVRGTVGPGHPARGGAAKSRHGTRPPTGPLSPRHKASASGPCRRGAGPRGDVPAGNMRSGPGRSPRVVRSDRRSPASRGLCRRPAARPVIGCERRGRRSSSRRGWPSGWVLARVSPWQKGSVTDSG